MHASVSGLGLTSFLLSFHSPSVPNLCTLSGPAITFHILVTSRPGLQQTSRLSSSITVHDHTLLDPVLVSTPCPKWLQKTHCEVLCLDEVVGIQLLRIQTDILTIFVCRLGPYLNFVKVPLCIVGGFVSINEVTVCRAWLVLGWVTVCGRVNHLGM